MSNLVKMPYVVQTSGQAVTINSNAKIEERMRQLAMQNHLTFPSGEAQGEGEFQEGFVEGLGAIPVAPEEPQVDPKVEAEQMLAEAEAECQRMKAEAEAYAKQIVEEAQANMEAEAARIYEEQRQLGYQEGALAASQEYEEMKNALANEMAVTKDQLEADYAQRQMTMESDIVDAIIQVFDQVFHIQFEDKKDILMYLITNTLMNVDAGKNFRIRVAEDNREFVENNLDALRAKIGADVVIDVATDLKLSGMDCVIETNYGVFECGLDTQLDQLMRDIRSLCI